MKCLPTYFDQHIGKGVHVFKHFLTFMLISLSCTKLEKLDYFYMTLQNCFCVLSLKLYLDLYFDYILNDICNLLKTRNQI